MCNRIVVFTPGDQTIACKPTGSGTNLEQGAP
jgi:hypothetical protein